MPRWVIADVIALFLVSHLVPNDDDLTDTDRYRQIVAENTINLAFLVNPRGKMRSDHI